MIGKLILYHYDHYYYQWFINNNLLLFINAVIVVLSTTIILLTVLLPVLSYLFLSNRYLCTVSLLSILTRWNTIKKVFCLVCVILNIFLATYFLFHAIVNKTILIFHFNEPMQHYDINISCSSYQWQSGREHCCFMHGKASELLSFRDQHPLIQDIKKKCVSAKKVGTSLPFCYPVLNTRMLQLEKNDVHPK